MTFFYIEISFLSICIILQYVSRKFSILDQRDNHKDDVTMVKKTKYVQH